MRALALTLSVLLLSGCAVHMDFREGVFSAALGNAQVAPSETDVMAASATPQVTGGAGSSGLFGWLGILSEGVTSAIRGLLPGAAPPPQIHVTPAGTCPQDSATLSP